MSAGEAGAIGGKCKPFNEVRGHDHLSERGFNWVVLNAVHRVCVGRVDGVLTVGSTCMEKGPVFEGDLGRVVFGGILHSPCYCLE